jgi:hypothetical protein
VRQTEWNRTKRDKKIEFFDPFLEDGRGESEQRTKKENY